MSGCSPNSCQPEENKAKTGTEISLLPLQEIYFYYIARSFGPWMFDGKEYKLLVSNFNMHTNILCRGVVGLFAFSCWMS